MVEIMRSRGDEVEHNTNRFYTIYIMLRQPTKLCYF